MSLRNWLVPTATGVVGLVAGLLIAAHRAEPHGPALFPVVANAAQTTPPGSSPVTLEDLRRVVREELAAMPAAGTVEHSAKVPVDEAPTPDQASAAIQARAILDSALYRRSWTESDREALQPQFVAMTPAQRDEWLLQYAQAVNQGRLVPEGERPPF